MLIKIIDYGFEHAPKRAHYNDAGADVYATKDMRLPAGRTMAMGLGFGLRLPDGYVGFVYPRSGLSREGITCELPPIDSGYTGEIHAILTNNDKNDSYQIHKGDRIGQLVIYPVTIPEFATEAACSNEQERGTNAFGSSGR